MNRNLSTEGIVLRKIDFNEADRIVSVLTPDLGKIDCVAKGARRLKSPFCGRLELLCRIQLTGSEGRGLVTLKEAQLIDSFPQENDLARHRACFMIAEISHKLIQSHQQIEGAYPLLREALEALQATPKTDSVLYAYLIRLMTLAGFLPHWNQCALCGERFNAQHPIYIRLGDAHALCEACHHPADRLLKPGIAQWINSLQNHPLDLSLRVQAKAEQHDDLWLWLKEVLQTVLPHPLKTEELLVRIR